MSNYFLRSAKPNLLTKNPSFEKGIKQNEIILKALIKAEIHCDDMWADIQVHGGIGVLEECAAALSSEVANGQILPTMVDGAYPLVVNEPYGVVLGMAPWNAPLILGLRAIAAPLAAGNTVIFRVSALYSPFSPPRSTHCSLSICHLTLPCGRLM